MGKIIINSYDEFAAHLGEELGTSEWLEVDQDRINLFADATLDHQWIHVDVNRAKEESPYTHWGRFQTRQSNPSAWWHRQRCSRPWRKSSSHPRRHSCPSKR